MRIAVLGKGGSGKTTIAAGLAQYLARSKDVLLIDADVNANQPEVCQLFPEKEFGGAFHAISDHVKGTRSDLGDAPMIATTPPAKGSNFFTITTFSEKFPEYVASKDRLHLVSVGSYTKSDVGVTCYHGKIDAVETLLHHFTDTKDEFVIMDATAGVDLLGTSLCIAFDYVVFIVEPTKKSVTVAQHYFEKNPLDNDRVFIVANKVQSQEDVQFIEQALQKPVSHIELSQELRQFDQGHPESFAEFIEKNTAVFDTVVSLCTTPRDRKEYYTTLAAQHKKYAASWYDAYYGKKVSEQFDTSLQFVEEL